MRLRNLFAALFAGLLLVGCPAEEDPLFNDVNDTPPPVDDPALDPTPPDDETPTPAPAG